MENAVEWGCRKVPSLCLMCGLCAAAQVGTPHFMSPELLSQRGYNHQTDVWCVCFFLSVHFPRCFSSSPLPLDLFHGCFIQVSCLRAVCCSRTGAS